MFVKEKNFFLSVILISSLLFLTSVEKFRPAKLPFVAGVVQSFTKEQKGVQLDYKVYSSVDSKIYLDRDLLAKGYQPVQITIQNNTPYSFVLGKEDISLPLVSASKVVSKFDRATLPKSIGYKVLGFFFWPFSVIGTIDSVKTYATHRDLKKDLSAKSVKNDQEVILPFSSLNRVLFVEKDKYQEEFSISLFNTDTCETIVFDANVKKAAEDLS